MPYPIRFQDANFDNKFVDFKTLEGTVRRYVPFGMPRLNQSFERTVFFLYGHDPKTGQVINQPCGTGVFVGVPAEGHDARLDCRHIYAVTAHHVIRGGGSIIRINTEEFREVLGFDVASRPIEPDIHEWEFITDGADVAAIDVTDRVSKGDAFGYIPLGLFANESFFRDVSFGIGEDGFMLGLFSDIPGENYNRIAARFGNVSLLAHKDDLIQQGNGQKHPSHIFDMRSRPGFSGSPVFVYRTPAGDLRDIAFGPIQKSMPPYVPTIGGYFGDATMENLKKIQSVQAENERAQHENDRKNTFLRLFGIHSAQYHDSVKAWKEKKTEAEKDAIQEGDVLKIPNSMTVVVPAWEITSLLDHPRFKKQRAEREKKDAEERLKRNAPEPESTASSVASTATEAVNPAHKEDFTALLGAAAKSKKQGG